MAIGGSCNKGNGSNGASRGRSYGLMLLLAFGAALLGVMILHKLRERRIFNLLIKEKDDELFSLHLLLQKERDYIKEVKGKNKEMKAKIYSLRTQKMELDRRLLEMQSTIDSLKDEQRTMEIAIEEKQNEIKMLREQDQMGNEKENPQVVALLESLKQKEAEIDDLKRQLQNPEKFWSVSADDPSKPQAKNVTAAEEKDNSSGGETARVEDENGNSENPIINKKEEPKVQNVSLSLNVANSTGVVSDQNVARKDIENEELGRHGNSQDEGEENHGNAAKGRMKMETRDGFEKNGKRGFVSNNVKGKRWRVIAKNRRLENNGKLRGVTRMRSVRLYKEEHGDLKSRVERAASKGGGVLAVEHNQQLEGRKAGDSSYEMLKKSEVSLDGHVKDSGKNGGDELFDESGSSSEGISNEDYREEIDESVF